MHPRVHRHVVFSAIFIRPHPKRPNFIFAFLLYVYDQRRFRRQFRTHSPAEKISDSPDGSWMDENRRRDAVEEERARGNGTARHCEISPAGDRQQADTGDGWDANETRNDRLLSPGQEPPSRAWNGFPLPIRVTTPLLRDAHRDTRNAFILWH